MLASFDAPTSVQSERRITIDVLDMEDCADCQSGKTFIAMTLAALARAAGQLRAAGMDVEVRTSRVTTAELSRAMCGDSASTLACFAQLSDASWATAVHAIAAEILAAGRLSLGMGPNRTASPLSCCAQDNMVPCCAGRG
jgi:hypothetical protein